MNSKKLSLFVAMLCLAFDSSTFAAENHPTGSWILVEINGEKVEGKAPTIRFVDNGMNGSTGVNRFFGKFAEEGDNLFGGNIGMTRRAGPPAAMKLEKNYVKALQAVKTHRIDQKQLVLENGDAVKLVFKADSSKR